MAKNTGMVLSKMDSRVMARDNSCCHTLSVTTPYDSREALRSPIKAMRASAARYMVSKRLDTGLTRGRNTTCTTKNNKQHSVRIKDLTKGSKTKVKMRINDRRRKNTSAMYQRPHVLCVDTTA
eukprot:TRINITY_DN15436_c0_g2_i2.p1 TRINITY_DN15436_c0_g2~~TRINITY_DN15436_c0_g2_i2.p1  ORF type:complete len:123 (-),score=0.91 TRINITY_DN15436_c0_g2_i2:5-373(-)